MDIKSYFNNFRPQIEAFLDKFFADQAQRAAKISPLCAQSIKMYNEYMHGGKMIRGCLTCLGYESAGGKDLKAIVQVAAGIEIIHHFILIHDDWIDNDLLRHSKPTIHLQFEKIFQNKFKKGDKLRWSGGMAVTLGDIGDWLGHQLIAQSNFPSSNKINALSLLGDNLVNTGFGQFIDITYDLQPGFDWNKIILIRKLKTAYYTLVMPLMIGISLASKDKKRLQAVENFGFPVGIAFQLRDDYLGLFGQEKVTGKSSTNDLREGKKTLIIAKALQLLKGKEKKTLQNALGNPNLKESEIKKVKEIIFRSGAVEECDCLARQLVEKGKKSISSLTDDPELAQVYSTLADYLITRDK